MAWASRSTARRIEAHILEISSAGCRLCDRHMEEDNARLDRGVGNFLRQADLQLSADFLPISGQQPEPITKLISMNLVTQLTGNATWATSLQYRDFRILWSSTFLYSLGSGMEQVAVGWLVFDLTGSAFMVGVASAARMAPFFFLGALSGVVADWVDRRALLQFITLGGSLVAGLMAP